MANTQQKIRIAFAATADKGFTLLEVLVAVVILGLAYVAILQNFSVSLGNINRISGHQEKTLTAALELDALDMEQESDGDFPVFMEGSRYDLVIVGNEARTFQSLRLQLRK